MKAANVNNSSRKTRKLIKKEFAEMLAEKRQLDKIYVSELCKRADISRGAFYSHYDDIYSVAEDFENELIDAFFDNARLLSAENAEQFVDVFFDYIRKNDENYRLLCRSNDLLFVAKKLTSVVSAKLLEFCNEDREVIDRQFVDVEINVFVEGLTCEYVKYCRGYSAVTLDELYAYTKRWVRKFAEERKVRRIK